MARKYKIKGEIMNNTKVSNNDAYIAGKVSTAPQKTHQVEGEWFYEFKVEVDRLSKTPDFIPVTISERTLKNQINVGDSVNFKGEFRSYNKQDAVKNKLVLYFFAKNYMTMDEIQAFNNDNVNTVKLTGFICKQPIFRQTPFGREICDVVIAVNRTNSNKSDYIPCIVWGRNAKFVADKPVGTKVEFEGRIQSREYKKANETETKTAYEISCKTVNVIENKLEESDEISNAI